MQNLAIQQINRRLLKSSQPSLAGEPPATRPSKVILLELLTLISLRHAAQCSGPPLQSALGARDVRDEVQLKYLDEMMNELGNGD